MKNAKGRSHRCRNITVKNVSTGLGCEYIAHPRDNGPDQSVQAHLLGVADKAKSRAAKIDLGVQGELIGLVHDLGKYSKDFQDYIRSAVDRINPDEDDYVDAKKRKGKVDHSTAGAQLIWQTLAEQGQLGQIVGQILALCVASHHSGLIDCLSSDESSFGEDVFGRRMAKSEQDAHFDEVTAKADFSVLNRFRELTAQPEVIAGIRASLARIVAHSPVKDDRSVIVQQQIGLLVRFLFSCLVDADRVDTADFEKPKAARHRMHGDYTAWDVMLERLETHLGRFELRHPVDQLRRDISQHCRNAAGRDKGIYTLTVPTGGGKTLASLRFALHHAEKHKMQRVMYVIPFTSIIDQNAEVVRSILEPPGDARSKGRIVLEHHSSLTPEQQGWREKMLSENWDAPVIYTTMVQFLETLFGAGTRGARRMHQLANAVLIFDEIQTLPVRCVHLFNNAIHFLVEQCGSTVILCTATQPLLNEVDASKGALRVPKGNEIMPAKRKLFDDLKRVEVINRRKPGGWTNPEIADLAAGETRGAGSCLVVVNTRKAATALYRLAKGQDDFALYHLSTDMCPAHRKAILGEIKAKLQTEQHVLCFSTQLIEAGVDVDFGSVIRFTAGLDSIAQAGGRCNRNGAREMGYVHVVNPQDENLHRLPDIKVGKEKAERVLNDFEADPKRYGNNLTGPEAMEWYYRNYFFDRARDMDYPVSASDVGHSDTLLELLSANRQSSAEHVRRSGQGPNIYLRQSFMSAARAFKAIDSSARGVIVPHGEAGRKLIADICAAYEVEKQFDLLRQAQQYTVNVLPHVLEQLRNAGAVQPIQDDIDIIYLSDNRYYSAEFGLTTEPTGSMELYCE